LYFLLAHLLIVHVGFNPNDFILDAVNAIAQGITMSGHFFFFGPLVVLNHTQRLFFILQLLNGLP